MTISLIPLFGVLALAGATRIDPCAHIKADECIDRKFVWDPVCVDKCTTTECCKKGPVKPELLKCRDYVWKSECGGRDVKNLECPGEEYTCTTDLCCEPEPEPLKCRDYVWKSECGGRDVKNLECPGEQDTCTTDLCCEPEPEPLKCCLLYTSPSPRDLSTSRMPSSA